MSIYLVTTMIDEGTDRPKEVVVHRGEYAGKKGAAEAAVEGLAAAHMDLFDDQLDEVKRVVVYRISEPRNYVRTSGVAEI